MRKCDHRELLGHLSAPPERGRRRAPQVLDVERRASSLGQPTRRGSARPPRVDTCKVTPRIDDVPVWVVPCLYVRRSHRDRGVTTALLRAAVDYAAKRGAPAVEGYPRSTTRRESRASRRGSAPRRSFGAPATARCAACDPICRGAGRLASPCARRSAPPNADGRTIATHMRTADLDVVALADGLSRGELSSTGLVERALRRYAETEPTIHAFAWLDEERAKRLATASDERRRSGAPVGRLEGIPIGVKDIFDTAGLPTENGSALFEGRIPEKSAAVVRAAESAGAIVLGKTITAELAYLTPGPTRNPWDPERTPGGSSMGSAAAVSAGVLPAAIGSQTNGSVIRPAAFCGVVGFKPTVGRISLEGAFEFARTLDHAGVLGRSV